MISLHNIGKKIEFIINKGKEMQNVRTKIKLCFAIITTGHKNKAWPDILWLWRVQLCDDDDDGCWWDDEDK